jgi:hypothetical protein
MAHELSPEHVGALQQLWYGHQNVPTRTDFLHAWRAVKSVGACDGAITDEERLYLLGKMLAIGTPGDVVAEVMAFDEHAGTPAELVGGIDAPREVRPGIGAWILYEGLSLAMSDGQLDPREVQALRSAGALLGVPEDVMDALAEQARQEATLRQRRIATLNSTIPTQFRFAHSEGAGG